MMHFVLKFLAIYNAVCVARRVNKASDDATGNGSMLKDWASELHTTWSKAAYSEPIMNLMSQVDMLRKINPQALAQTVRLPDIQNGLADVLKNKFGADIRESCLATPSNALSSTQIAELCRPADEDIPFPSDPLELSRMPIDSFTRDVGVSGSWENGFKFDPDLLHIVESYPSDASAVGLQKVGFAGLVNILIEERQWVTFAGPLLSLDSNFRSTASGPHGPLYITLRKTAAVRSIQNSTEGQSAVLAPPDWYAAVMPQNYKDVLVGVLKQAIKSKLMRKRVAFIKRKSGRCAWLVYPKAQVSDSLYHGSVASHKLPESKMRICSYEELANEMRHGAPKL